MIHRLTHLYSDKNIARKTTLYVMGLSSPPLPSQMFLLPPLGPVPIPRRTRYILAFYKYRVFSLH
jgi:hypothetical protein